MYRSPSDTIGGLLLGAGSAAAASVPFHWGDTPPAERLLQLAMPGGGEGSPARGKTDGGFEWCGAFSIDSPTELIVAMHSGGGQAARPPRLLQLMVEAVGAALVVCVDLVSTAPYRLCNDCQANTLAFNQKGSERVHVVPPRSALDFTWDEPQGSRELHVAVLPREPQLDGSADGGAAGRPRLLSDGDLVSASGDDASARSSSALAKRRAEEADVAEDDFGEAGPPPPPPPAELVLPTEAETARRGLEFDIRLSELREPSPHPLVPGGPPALWTTVYMHMPPSFTRLRPAPPIHAPSDLSSPPLPSRTPPRPFTGAPRPGDAPRARGHVVPARRGGLSRAPVFHVSERRVGRHLARRRRAPPRVASCAASEYASPPLLSHRRPRSSLPSRPAPTAPPPSHLPLVRFAPMVSTYR